MSNRFPQIVSDFLVDSIDVLERCANANKPPLKLDEIEDLAIKAITERPHSADTQTKLAEMKRAFLGRGDLQQWTEDVLAKIDKCFQDHFFTSGVVHDALFALDSPKAYIIFSQYQSAVDQILRENRATVPPYAREYFAYSMFWKERGYRFPIPLGTASVIEFIHSLTQKHASGLNEVRATLFSETTLAAIVAAVHTRLMCVYARAYSMLYARGMYAHVCTRAYSTHCTHGSCVRVCVPMCAPRIH